MGKKKKNEYRKESPVSAPGQTYTMEVLKKFKKFKIKQNVY